MEGSGAHPPILYLQPVQQFLRSLRLPHGGQWRRGGGAAGRSFAQIFANHGVEQARLAGAGSTKETDDGVRTGELAALCGLLGYTGNGLLLAW